MLKRDALAAGWLKIAESPRLQEQPRVATSLSENHRVQRALQACSPLFNNLYLKKVTDYPLQILHGSEFINYHGIFSIVVLALVDADYNFIFAYCRCQGRISDGDVYMNTGFYQKMCRNELGFPPSECVPQKQMPLPYVFVADSAFALTENMMKPYAGTHNKGSRERVFNYRLSRARSIVENVFGIMSAVFRVLRKPILLQPDKATNIAMTCALLHNFLKRSKNSKSLYNPTCSFDTENEYGVIQPGSWRNDRDGITSLIPMRNIPRRAPLFAKDVRDQFSEFFITNGAVSWQNNYCK
ncbi:hypothetical protein NQ318_023243, partial [Aromia moschata]